MNLKKETSSAVIFLVASIIFLSSTTSSNNVFGQTEGEDLTLASTNYENFQNCLSYASGQYNTPTGDQIVNCFVESGYVQGSSSTSNAADIEDESENVQVNVVGDESEDEDEDESEDEDEDESEDEDEDESEDEDEDESEDEK